MSGTSKHALYGLEEVVYGVPVGGSAALQTLRYTSFDLSEQIDYVQSEDINPSREPTDQVKVGTRLAGSMGFELAFDIRWQRMLRRLMLFDVDVTASVTLTAATFGFSEVTNSFEDIAGIYASVAMKSHSGDWLRITNTANNGAEMIVKAAIVYVSGTYTTYNAGTSSLAAPAGNPWPDLSVVANGTAVTFYTAGAVACGTGEILQLEFGGGLTYTVKISSGYLDPAGSLRRTGQTAGNGELTLPLITASGAILSGIKLVDEAAGATITVRRAGIIYPGSVERSWTFEGKQDDLTNVFELFTGCMFPSMDITIPPKGKITGNFQIKGKDKLLGSASVSTGTPAIADAHQVMSSEDNLFAVMMGGSEGVRIKIDSTTADAASVITTLQPHGVQTGDLIVITGSTDIDYNRNWIATRLSTTTFTIPSGVQDAQVSADAGVFRKLKLPKAVVDAGFTIDNQLLEETQLGERGIVAQPIGTLSCSGTLNIYFADLNEQNRYHDDEATGVAFILQDTTTSLVNFYVFEFPRIKYTQAPASISGNNNSRVNAIQWAAALDPTEQHSLRVCIS